METGFPKFLIKWLRVFLILIPLAITGYSIYWIILVTQPIFIEACGPGCIALAVLLIVSSFISSIFGFLSFKNIQSFNYQSWIFSTYFISTAAGLLLVMIVLLMTTTESQRVYDQKIGSYYETHNNSITSNYHSSYSSDYQKIVYQYAYGQKSYEAYLIIGFAWIICFVAFFATHENYNS
ncbi:hypothetical protein M9Y10_044878 [Tritrichomonas musculus]|uniref:Transmembrane protein n=1 Tax=Tritrichomonas musculus TaxID=1915356 RepID=A0ABR2JTY8_9EUKA